MAKTLLGKSLIAFEHPDKCSFTVFVTGYLQVILLDGVVKYSCVFLTRC